MKRVHELRDWASARLVLHRDRRRIIDLCRARAMSIQDLSRALGLNPGSVHNHVHQLHDAGFLEIEATRVVNGITEKKYRRTAQYFRVFDVREEDVPARNRAICRYAQGAVGRVLEADPKPSIYFVTARLSPDALRRARELAEELRQFVVEQDGTGELECEAVLCMGRASDDG